MLLDSCSVHRTSACNKYSGCPSLDFPGMGRTEKEYSLDVFLPFFTFWDAKPTSPKCPLSFLFFLCTILPLTGAFLSCQSWPGLMSSACLLTSLTIRNDAVSSALHAVLPTCMRGTFLSPSAAKLIKLSPARFHTWFFQRFHKL